MSNERRYNINRNGQCTLIKQKGQHATNVAKTLIATCSEHCVYQWQRVMKFAKILTTT